MATLHGILAELGIENPTMHSERQPEEPQWIVDKEFVPEAGKSYELAFGRIPFDKEQGPVLKRVRIDGPAPNGWIDLDAQKPLDRELLAYPVRAFRQLRQERLE